MYWIILAIAAPALYAISNFFDRFILQKRIKDPFVLTAIGGLLAFGFGFLFWAIQLFPVFSGLQMVVLLFAGTLFEIALIPWYKAVSLDDASRVAPLFQSFSVFALILSYFILGETLSGLQLIGFVLILSGAFFLSVDKFSRKIFSLRPSFWYMMLSSFLFALPVVLFKLVIIDQSFWPALSYELMGGLIGAVLVILYLVFSRRVNSLADLKFKSGTFFILVANEVIYLVGHVLNFLAVSLAPVALVSALGGTQPLFMLVFGVILSVFWPKIIKEDIAKKTLLIKLISVLLIFLGCVAISF
ncbi:MAG: EamA family transporter [Candidatus Buchananbacteria bacterium]|nr:EamA family transporter [Candidatus Buchananbacteria bacterium]